MLMSWREIPRRSLCLMQEGWCHLMAISSAGDRAGWEPATSQSELDLKARWATHLALSAHKSHKIPRIKATFQWERAINSHVEAQWSKIARNQLFSFFSANGKILTQVDIITKLFCWALASFSS